MTDNIPELIERLQNYYSNLKGEFLDPTQVEDDCHDAADALESMQADLKVEKIFATSYRKHRTELQAENGRLRAEIKEWREWDYDHDAPEIPPPIIRDKFPSEPPESDTVIGRGEKRLVSEFTDDSGLPTVLYKFADHCRLTEQLQVERLVRAAGARIEALEAEVDTLDATITESALSDFQLRCAPGDLDAWGEAAKDSNMSLNAWINWKVNL